MRAAGPGKLKPGVLKHITYTQRPAVSSSSGSAVRHLALLYRLGVRAVALRFLVARKKSHSSRSAGLASCLCRLFSSNQHESQTYI